MLYEAAWVNRMIADAEIESAREKVVLESLRKQQDRMGVKDPQPTPPSILAVRAAEVPLTAIPIQAGEQKMRQQYQAIIASGRMRLWRPMRDSSWPTSCAASGGL